MANELTAKQESLLELATRGLTHAEMAEISGYGSRESVGRALNSPRMRAAITERVAHMLRVEGAPAALQLLLDTVRDEKVARGVRVDAAKTLLDRAGHIAPKAQDAKAAEAKRPEDMTPTELAALIERLEREKSGRAVSVNGAPDNAPPPANPLSFLD